MVEIDEDVEIDFDSLRGILNALKPTPILSVSDWADKNRYLSSVASAMPGLWKTSLTPYLKEIMDNLSPTSPYQEVVVKKASQQGFSEAALNMVGTFIDIAPSPILYIMPTVAMARSLSKTRVKTMIEQCPNLRAKIAPARQRDGGNTTMEKEFDNGVFIMTGANSAAELASRPIRALILDEIDRYPADVEGEGSPIGLATARTITFNNKKIFKLSTPTNKGASLIDLEIENTDQRYYHVQLPCCEGAPQVLKFENLTWEKGKYNTVKYVCEHCEALIDERHKTKILASGRWIPSCPEKSNSKKVGYIINGLYSPKVWLSWADIAEQYENIKGDVGKDKTFQNTILGESYAESAEKPEYNNIYNRAQAEGYKEGTINDEVLLITAGADVQRDRIEIEVVGWTENKESYSIEYKVLYGDTAARVVWDELASFIQKYYTRPDGIILPIARTAVDSGYNKNEVYRFCQRFDATKVFPVKGQDKQDTIVKTPQLVDISHKGERIGKVKLWNVGVSVVKSELYGWLRQNKNEDGTYPMGYCHFPSSYGIDYYKGITAEKLTYKLNGKGFKEFQWKKEYDRNEPLDCRVYARAAANVLGLDRFTPAHWLKIKANLNGYVPPPPVTNQSSVLPPPKPTPPQKNSSSFWND